VNTEVFRTQPLLGDQWSRELRNYSLCCSARFSATNIAYYRHLSPVLLHITKFRATVNTVLIATAFCTFHISRFNISISEGHGRVCFRGASFRFRSRDWRSENRGFSQSHDALFIVLSNSVFITILGYKGTKHTCRQPQPTNFK